MQISPLQVLELSQKQSAASAGIGTWIRRIWAMIKNSVDLRLVLFAGWVSAILLYRILYSVTYPVFQDDTPKCTNLPDCSDCLAVNYFLNSSVCAWVGDKTEACLPNIAVPQNQSSIFTDASRCPSLSCPVLGLSLNGPFVCTSSAQFTFFLILCWIPLLLCNMLQQCRFERLVSTRATGRAMTNKANARQMMRQTMVRKPKESIPVTCNRCGQHLPADTFPRCTPCIYSQLFSGMWWLTLALIPLIFFVWASWDPRVDTAFYYVLFLQVIPPGYLLALLLLSFFAFRWAQTDEPTASGEEAVPLEQAAEGSADMNELTRLNADSKAVLQQVSASDFVDAILSNIDYGINAEQLAARARAAQQPQQPPPAAPQSPQSQGAAGVLGGFFNKVVNATVSVVQTAAAQLQFSDQPKEVEQEEIIWVQESVGRKVDGGPWSKTFKLVWIESLIVLGILWAFVILGAGDTSVSAFSRGRVVSFLVSGAVLCIWAFFQVYTRYCLVLTTKQVMLLSRSLSFPFCLWTNPVLVARLPFSLVTQVKLRALVSGTWCAPFCIAGDGDGPLGPGYCEFCVATQYRGDLESLEHIRFDLNDADEFKAALEKVGISVDKMDPDADGVFGSTQRTRGLAHWVVMLVQLALILIAAAIGLSILSRGITAFNLAQALILFLFAIVLLTWTALRRKIWISTTIYMKNPTAGQSR